MSRSCRKILRRFNVKRTIIRRVTHLRHCVHLFWNRVLTCCVGKSGRYKQLLPSTIPLAVYPSRETSGASCCCDHHNDSSDLVALKIILLGDCQIGKTSFLTKYIGREKSKEMEGGEQVRGLNQMNKTLCVRGARIAYKIWEVQGNDNQNQLAVACKDSVAMLIMFDLTSRCTLNSVISWYQQARKWNQNAIPVLVGTKFDDFVQLPLDLQWTIASQARTYAKALNATLFFSSSTYNINVNKIFKFITAKIFNLPWSVERNLTIGEPIIDF